MPAPQTTRLKTIRLPLIYLNDAKREHLATRGGIKGTQRDDEAHLARVINDLITKDMERK